jgi:hypothetical protein
MKTVRIVATLPQHYPGFNPPIPNLNDPEIARRLNTIAILNAAEDCAKAGDTGMALERIHAALNTLRA